MRGGVCVLGRTSATTKEIPWGFLITIFIKKGERKFYFYFFSLRIFFPTPARRRLQFKIITTVIPKMVEKFFQLITTTILTEIFTAVILKYF